MSEWFTWKGENFYAVRGEELFFMGSAAKRYGEDKWECFAHGERLGLFITEEAARRRVERAVNGHFTPQRATWNRGEVTEAAKSKWRLWRRLNGAV